MIIAELDTAVMAELDQFAGACVDDIQAAADATGKWAKKELKATSPKKSGEYAREWSVDKKKTRTGTQTTIYNKKLYMLSHLLEYGHAKTNGGRTKAFGFIKPVDDEAQKKFEEELKRRIENGH